MFYFLSVGKLKVFTGLSWKVKGTVQIFDISCHWLDYGSMVWTLHEQCNATFHAVCCTHVSTQTSSYCWYKDVFYWTCVFCFSSRLILTQTTSINMFSLTQQVFTSPYLVSENWSGTQVRPGLDDQDTAHRQNARQMTHPVFTIRSEVLDLWRPQTKQLTQIRHSWTRTTASTRGREDGDRNSSDTWTQTSRWGQLRLPAAGVLERGQGGVA